jgi:hypothetical protein
VVLNVPSYLLFGLLDGIFIPFVENLEEIWVDLEVILGDLDMLGSIGVFCDNLIEGISKLIDLISDFTFLPVS